MNIFIPLGIFDQIGVDIDVFEPAPIIIIKNTIRPGSPNDLRHCLGQLAKPFFAVAQHLFNGFSIIDVHDRADIAEKSAVRTYSRGGGVDKPAVFAVFTAQSVFYAECARYFISRHEGVICHFLFVGMNGIHPAHSHS